MIGSSVTDVCLSAGAACISFPRSPCTAADLPSGERGVGGVSSVCVLTRKRGSVTARLDAPCHMLSYTHWCVTSRRTQRHTHMQTFARHKHAHTRTHALARLASQEATGPLGQSLRVWFVCLDLIIETGLFLQPLLQLFYTLTSEKGREGVRERKQSFDSVFSQW